MAKDLKAILKKYATSTRDARVLGKYADKETVAKNDAPSSRDSQFSSDVAMFNRHKEHGYNPGEDDAVYDSMAESASEKLARIKKALFEGYKVGDTVTYKGQAHRVIHVHDKDEVPSATGGVSKGMKGKLNIQKLHGRASWPTTVDPKDLKEGRIKELDTKDKEEKRLGKKVLSDKERSQLKALKKKDK